MSRELPGTPIALEARDRDGARLFSPSAGRNKVIIAEWLAERLPLSASVLEVGSGTGEHGAALGALRSDVVWQYSDPDAASRARNHREKCGVDWVCQAYWKSLS